jgi:hypothetical protein
MVFSVDQQGHPLVELPEETAKAVSQFGKLLPGRYRIGSFTDPTDNGKRITLERWDPDFRYPSWSPYAGVQGAWYVVA